MSTTKNKLHKSTDKIRRAHAQKAIQEAKARHKKIDAVTSQSKDEKNGRGGLDPARYGDWENKGIISDF